MKKLASEPRLVYPILLFACIFPLSLSRPVSFILDGVGRNSVWFIFPSVLLALAGTWMSLQISKRYADLSLILASGEIVFRWLAPVAYLLHACFYLSVATYTIALSGDFSSLALQYGDPRTAMLFNSIIAACAALFPLETLIRYSQVVVVIVTPLFLLVSSAMFTNAQWSWLYPVYSVQEIVHPIPAAAAILCVFSPLATIALISRKKSNISFRTLTVFLAIAAVSMSYAIAMGIATFGIHSARQMDYLTFYAQSAVHIENFIFERIIFLGSLFLIYFKIVGNAFFVRCAALGFTQATGTTLGLLPILLAGGICAALLWMVDLPAFFQKAPVWIGYGSFSLIVAFPALLYVIMLLRGTNT